MINQRADHQGSNKNPQIQQEEQCSLLRQADLQACAHCGQAKHSAQDGKNNPKDKDSRACAEEQQSRAEGSVHRLSFQRTFVLFVDAIVVVGRYACYVRRNKNGRILALRRQVGGHLRDDGHGDGDCGNG